MPVHDIRNFNFVMLAVYTLTHLSYVIQSYQRRIIYTTITLVQKNLIIKFADKNIVYIFLFY